VQNGSTSQKLALQKSLSTMSGKGGKAVYYFNGRLWASSALV